jgi:hypothetical protein
MVTRILPVAFSDCSLARCGTFLARLALEKLYSAFILSPFIEGRSACRDQAYDFFVAQSITDRDQVASRSAAASSSK